MSKMSNPSMVPLRRLLLVSALVICIGNVHGSSKVQHKALVAESRLAASNTFGLDVSRVTPPNTKALASSSSHRVAVRGGDALEKLPTKALGGALWFGVVDVCLRKFFKAKGISFPSTVAGTCALFVSMVLLQIVKPGLGDAAFEMLTPGAGLLAKWLPVFFVPGLAMLPLAPSIGSPIEIVKVLFTVVFGMVFTLSTTSFTVLGLRTLLGKVEEEVVDANAPAAVAAPAAKPYSQETVDFLLKGAVASACLSIGLDRTSPDSQWATPLRTIFMGFSTVASYVWAARLPGGFVKVVHPLVTSTAIVLLITRATAVVTGSTFLQVLKTYKTGSLAPLATGAGDILLFLLGPAVISLAIAMYSRKALMQENLLVVIVAMLVSSVGTLFGTATFVRALNIGGAGASGDVLRLSMLPRNVTTALAMAIASILGGDLAITASVVVLTGIIGATYGGRLLTKMGVKDPVSRGLGIGSAAQGLGVASFVNEKDAFPFAAIAMVLTAVSATTLVSIPAVKDTLIAIATGPSTISAVTDAAASL